MGRVNIHKGFIDLIMLSLIGENKQHMSYQQIDLEKLNEDVEASQQQGSNSSTRQGAFLKLDPGTHKLRLLPPLSTSKAKVPYVERWYHGPLKKEGKTRFYTCGDKHGMQQGCPLCIVGNKPKLTYLMNVINRKDGGTYVLQMSRAKKDTLIIQLQSMPQMLDVDKGYDFNYIAKGNGIDRRYDGPIVLAIPSPVGKHDPAYNLDRLIDQGYNYEEMKGIADFLKGSNQIPDA